MKNIPSDNNRSDDTVFTILESIPDEAFIMDTKGIIINANSLFAQYYGKQPHECIGINVFELIVTVLKNKEIADHRKEKVAEVLLTGKRTTFEDVRNNHIRRFTINPVRSQAGEITRLFITIQDIPEPPYIEFQRNHYKPRFDFALTAANAGVWEWNLKTNDLFWSDEIWSLYGLKWSDEKPSFKLWESTICPDDIETAIKIASQAVQNFAELNIEFRVTHPDGSLHWLMSCGKPLYGEDGQTTHYIGTVIDITERKEMELELIESKIRYGYAMDASQSGVWEWNVATDELSWSEQLWALYGLKVNSVPLNKQLCVDTVHPEDREMTSWIIQNAVSNGTAASLEYRVFHPDGSLHWLTSRGKPLYDADGKVTHYIGAIIDITERKQIELELIASRKSLHEALGAARAGVWEWNLKTNEYIWSDEMWLLYGMERDNNKPSFDLWASTIHPDDRESTILAVNTASKSATDLNVEYRIVHPDGSLHWLMFRGKPQIISKGEPVCYVGTAIDITERKEAEIALNESEKKMIFALEATNSGVWEWDVSTDEVFWTDNVWKLYGLELKSKQMTHKLCESNIYPDDRDVMFEKVMESANKGKEINVEYRVAHSDGVIHWLQCRGVPSYNTDGRLKSYIGTVTDITNRKTLLNELIDGKERLTQALDAAHAGVWEWYLYTGENFWSDEVWLLYGLEKGNRKASFELWKSTIHPNDREMTIQIVSSAVENEIIFDIEYRTFNSDGSSRWLMSRGKPKYDLHGRVDRYIGTIIDITERKEIEENFRKSRERLDFVLANTHVGIWDLNLHDGSTQQTLEHARIFGYETIPPVWSFEKFISHIIPEDRPRIEALIRSALEQQGKYSFECQIQRVSGELRWIWIAGAFKTGTNGESSHIVGVIRDITERKTAEQQIIEGKVKLDTALASISDAVFISDNEGNLMEFNDAYVTFHRFRAKSECAKTLAEYPEIIELLNDNGECVPVELWPVPRALRGESLTNKEYLLHRKDTGETWSGSYSFAPVRNKYGEITGSVIVVRDITEQKIAQKLLQESELKFRTIFDQSPIGIAIRDVEDGKLFDVNNSWERIFGYKKEEVIGHSIKDLGLYLQNEDYESNLKALNEHGNISNKPMRFQNKSGNIASVLYSADFITFNGNTCVLVMITDITLQVMQQVSIEQLEQVVEERTKDLKDELKRMNSFLHMISHEYRTPLAIIRGNLDLIELKNKNCNCVNPVEMKKIRRAIDRLVEVMEDSMHESRIYESRTALSFKSFQLVTLIASQLDSFLALWPEQAIQYTEALEKCEIIGDPSRLKLVIFNLLDNARKYSSPYSVIELDCHLEGDEAVISIRNQSLPITKGEADVLFEKYRRGSNSMNTGGAGLGLWMVKSIIDQHKGMVSLKGIESGVEVTVRLPICHQAGI